MRALLSVSDKSGIVDLARALSDRGIEIISTGGTAAAISDAGIPVVPVADVTGFQEMLDGRVKTLHPAIHGGLLARLEREDHRRQIDAAGIFPITFLVSNLYPFEQTVSTGGATPDEIVEQIDIGGPAMVRAAAKNFDHVYAVTSPDDYTPLLNILESSPQDQQAFRRALAAKAFAHVSTYDSLVAAWLRQGDPQFPEELTLGLRRHSTLRYGENPHQRAAAYRSLRTDRSDFTILEAEQVAGAELSFNNYLDLDAAWRAANLFDEPAVAIVKHTVPCGLAVRSTLADAWQAALAGDPVSAFGGIVAANRPIDAETASRMRSINLDVIAAPAYEAEAFASLQRKKNTRLLRLPASPANTRMETELDLRPVAGGLLVQAADTEADDRREWRVVTERSPTLDQWRDLRFAWAAARLVKSNAIVFAFDNAIVGVGAGQPNRLESVAIAARKAADRAAGAAMASDAFFPFSDGIERAIEAGITAVIQPGGSIRDQEVINAANGAGIAMVFTGTRHFRH